MSQDGLVNKHTSVKNDDSHGNGHRFIYSASNNTKDNSNSSHQEKVTSILPYGVNRGRIDQIIKTMNAPLALVNEMKAADLVVTTKNYHRRRTQALQTAEKMGKPVFVLRRNTVNQIEQFVRAVSRDSIDRSVTEADRSLAILEAERAAHRIAKGEGDIELRPQNSHIRRLQHQIATQSGFESSSLGREPLRRVVIHGS